MGRPGTQQATNGFTWRKVGGTAFCLLAIAGLFLVARRLTASSWPLEDATPGLVVAACAAYFASYGFRALGWQQVFPSRERPDWARCLAACGGASASGAVLPFRLDYVVKVSIIRRLRGVTLGLDTIVLSIVALGMIDAVALLPIAVSAFATSGTAFRLPLLVVVLFCLGCLAVLVAGPRLTGLPLVHRSKLATRVFRRVGGSATMTRSTLVAGLYLFICWGLRAFGGAALLMALGAGFSPLYVFVILCMAGAAAILPITAGPVTTMGATGGILFALGVSSDVAINFALASGLIATAAGLTAAAVGVTGSVLQGALARPQVAVG